MIKVTEVRAWVDAFDPAGDARADRSREAVLALLAGVSQLPSRTEYAPGHVTASAIVLAPTAEQVLLVFHARLRRWLQPGGHLEETDRTVAEAARREVLEETGILVDPGIPTVLVGVDVHEIPASRDEPAHLHHDLVFRFVASQVSPAPAPHGLRVAWCPVGRLEDFEADAPLQWAVRRACRSAVLPGS